MMIFVASLTWKVAFSESPPVLTYGLTLNLICSWSAERHCNKLMLDMYKLINVWYTPAGVK